MHMRAIDQNILPKVSAEGNRTLGGFWYRGQNVLVYCPHMHPNHNCYAHYIGICLFLTVLFYVQKLSISPDNRSIDNPEFLRWINKLKESNEELSDSNRIISSRIDTLEKEHFGLSQYKLVRLQIGLNEKNMFEGDLV
jgi:cell division protein FtsB